MNNIIVEVDNQLINLENVTAIKYNGADECIVFFDKDNFKKVNESFTSLSLLIEEAIEKRIRLNHDH